MGMVYHIFNTVNGKAYVGQTWGTLETRWKTHCRPSSCCVHLKRAIEKYGKDVFVRSVLTLGLSTQEEMDAAEAYWAGYFDCYKNGYNIKQAGSCGRHSEETKEAIGAYWRGRKRPQEFGDHLSAAKKGVPLSEEHKKALRVPHRKMSEENRKKMGRHRIGKPMHPKARTKLFAYIDSLKRPIVDQNGVVYESASEAARILDLWAANICKVLKGKCKSAGGHFFKYKDR